MTDIRHLGPTVMQSGGEVPSPLLGASGSVIRPLLDQGEQPLGHTGSLNHLPEAHAARAPHGWRRRPRGLADAMGGGGPIPRASIASAPSAVGTCPPRSSPPELRYPAHSFPEVIRPSALSYIDIFAGSVAVSDAVVTTGPSLCRCITVDRTHDCLLMSSLDTRSRLMSTCDMPSSTHPENLAALRDQILADLTLPEQRRRNIASALTGLASALGRPLDALPTEPAALRALMANRSAAEMGFRPGRWRNVRSLLSSALVHVGLVQLPARLDTPLSPAWGSLLGKGLPRDARFRLARFGRWCSLEGFAPEQVTDAIMDRFREAQETASLIDDPKRRTHDLTVYWNRAADALPDWPQQRLTVPDNPLYYTPGWDVYPASLRADVTAWLAYLAGGGGNDLLSELVPRRPLRPATLRNRRAVLRLYLGALVLSGENPATMVDLRSVVTPPRARVALGFFLDRFGNKATYHIEQIARLALAIARHWVRADAADIAQLSSWTARLTPPRSGMTEKNKARLRPFLNEEVYDRLVDLPRLLCREVERQQRRLGAPNAALAQQFQTAVLLQILLLIPLRLKNLTSLRIGTELVRLPGGEMFIVLQEADTKNSIPFDAPIADEAAAMIGSYIDLYRPLLGTAGDWLFPGRQAGRAKSHDAIRDQIVRAVAERCGLPFNPHAFRHLAAYMILKHDPAAYGLVQRVLGHKQLDTTIRFYTGLETPRALEHFQRLVLERSGQLTPPIAKAGFRA